RRMRALKASADFTYGLIGRSPEQVAGLITGLAMDPSVLEALRAGCGQNLIRYYEHARANDLYLCFAVVPPTGLPSRDIFPGQARDDPSLQVVAEDDSGVTVSGMKRRPAPCSPTTSGSATSRHSTRSSAVRASRRRCHSTRPAWRCGRGSPTPRMLRRRPT